MGRHKAYETCKKENGNIVSIANAYEQAFVESLLAFETEPVWIGLVEISFTMVSSCLLLTLSNGNLAYSETHQSFFTSKMFRYPITFCSPLIPLLPIILSIKHVDTQIGFNVLTDRSVRT